MHDVDAPRAARRFVSSVLTRWGVSVETIERAQLLASELVSNAFMYGHGSIRILVQRLGGERIGGERTGVERRGAKPAEAGGAFRVEVCNTGRGHPSVRHPAADEVSGRGLQIVEELSGAWGSVTNDGETSVWFEMPADASV